MKIDNTDIKILFLFNELDDILTTSDIAKKIFEIKNDTDLRKKDSFIRARLTKLLKQKFLSISSENGTHYYALNKDNVTFSKDKITVNEILDSNNICILHDENSILFCSKKDLQQDLNHSKIFS